MYKQNSTNKRRSSRSFHSNSSSSSSRGSSSKPGYAKRSFGGGSSRPSGGFGGYRRGGGGFKSGPRKDYGREFIRHEMYISDASVEVAVSPYTPNKSFAEYFLHPILKKNIIDRKYVNPTKIQDSAIPEILRGSDILGLASTGSGKTAAFLIPMIDKALKSPKQKCLIITPTRELASQIGTEFRKFAEGTNIQVVMIIGGASIRDQINILRREPQFVVATPGRLMDVEKRHAIRLDKFNNIVLDEVDQMLDMGFVDDIKQIVAKLATPRQSLFFSATMSAKEEGIANSLLTNPIKIEIEKQSPLKNIDQKIVKVASKNHKIQALHELLITEEFEKVLIFSKTKRGADDISDELQKKGLKVDSLHGDKSQMKRSKVLTKFRRAEIDILVATDVAARGIDIPDISHVINYDEPATYNDYIHRIGRTGRIGKKGKALTFVIGH